MSRHLLHAIGLAAACLALAACAVPLGPGYEIEKQEVVLTYSPGAPQTVRVRAAYRLKNAGNADLTELDLALPRQLAGDELRVRVLVEGREAGVRRKEAAAGQIAGGDGAGEAAVATISFASPWPKKRKLALVLEYDLELNITLDAFYFDAAGWFPSLVVPDALFAKGRARADKVDLRLRVPEGWRALSSGRDRGSRRVRSGSDTLRELRFELRRHDFAPYVVAGKYHEQRFESHSRTLIFWTLAPQPSFQSDATNYFQALAALENFFGPRRDPRHPVWIVEEAHRERTSTAGTFPHGLRQLEGLLKPDSAVPSGKDGDLTPLRNRMLFARLWTAHDASPGESDSLLDRGLAVYASMVTAPSMAAQRTAFIGESCAEQAQDSRKERDPVFFQTLFFHALEDRIGKENVQRGLRRVMQGMQGSTYGWAEIRSALEAESGQNLAEMFRTWLGDGGIPEEFCKKYAKGSDQ